MVKRESDIRPATGIKIKQKKTQFHQNKQKSPAQVIPNVNVSENDRDVQPPTENSAKILQQLNSAKGDLLNIMKEFGALLKDSKLPENRSVEEKRHEQNVVINLMRAASVVEQLSPTEGTLGVATFGVRQALSLRDAGNRLAYDLYKLDQRVKELEKLNDG